MTQQKMLIPAAPTRQSPLHLATGGSLLESHNQQKEDKDNVIFLEGGQCEDGKKRKDSASSG